MSYGDLSDPVEDGVFLKNDKAWRDVFRDCPELKRIDDDRTGIYYLNADDLKKYGRREPRLMAKIESKYNVPTVLKEKDLCIMPCKTRGNYVIGHFDAFIDIKYPDSMEAESIHIDWKYDTLDPHNISKEPGAILSAFNYGILDEIAGYKEKRMRITNFGRESTTEFEYNIDNVLGEEPYRIEVSGSQLEMDGVFESEDCIINIEAKMGQKDDFLARQLYYPYRLLRNKTEKEILNVFLTYSAGSIFTHIYKVEDPFNYNSFKLIESKRFDFFKGITLREIAYIVKNTKIAADPVDVPFPQADSMHKVIDTLELIGSNPDITDRDLAYRMSIVGRQGGYYGNACKYLGLTERVRPHGTYKNNLSAKGREIFNMNPDKRMLEIIRLMARHEVFNHFLREYLEQGEKPKKDEVAAFVAEKAAKMDSKTDTPKRRASTVISWIDWVMSLCAAE